MVFRWCRSLSARALRAHKATADTSANSDLETLHGQLSGLAPQALIYMQGLVAAARRDPARTCLAC